MTSVEVEVDCRLYVYSNFKMIFYLFELLSADIISTWTLKKK